MNPGSILAGNSNYTITSGMTVVDARPGMEVAWTPEIADGARFLVRRARAGDRILTLGAGDVDAAVPLILEALA